MQISTCLSSMLVLASASWCTADDTGSKSGSAPAVTTNGLTAALGVADPSATPEEIVRTNWTAVIAVLQNRDLDGAAKEKEIERIASPLIDFELMGKLALGRLHWGKLTPAQRERYLPLFEERIKRAYRGKIALYEGDEILLEMPDVKESPGESEAGADSGKSRKPVEVPVELVSNGKRALVLHKFRYSGERWKLYDVEIEGVSILLTYRSQFNDILRTGTVEDLLSRLEEPSTN